MAPRRAPRRCRRRRRRGGCPFGVGRGVGADGALLLGGVAAGVGRSLLELLSPLLNGEIERERKEELFDDCLEQNMYMIIKVNFSPLRAYCLDLDIEVDRLIQ